MNAITQLLRPAVNFVLPPRCASCGVIIGSDSGFCPDCWNQLQFISHPWCASCGLPLPFEGAEDQECAACLAEPPTHDGIRAAVAYCDISSQIALKLKYGGKIGLAEMIASHLQRHLPTDLENCLLVPVPLHWTRLWGRSFNQSGLIARALSGLSGIENAPDLLQRTKRTELLRGKTEKDRRKEVNKAFAVNKSWMERVNGATILLVDDVYTSGATTDACVKTLKKAGANRVEIFCWARVLREENMPSDIVSLDIA